MDERLNSNAIRQWLERDGRKLTWLAKVLNVSGSLVDRMLGSGHIPKERTLKALAALMGVEVSTLLIPRTDRKSA